MDKGIVGKQLKKARSEKNLSQEELAQKVGISRMMISRYEISSSDIPLDKLQKIAEILEKPVSYFFGEEPKQDSQEVWKEAQKYLELLKNKVGGNVSLSPKEMLAFSLGPNANTEQAIAEAKTMMKNWYIANKLEESTNKSFEEWWENLKKEN
ncbi:helix-turn-helix domain-containing protein [Candidatus Nomurabacteria bacterium]|nr:helix-turn-helix domain-containing protein [Candidatus Nomurabacteria bacterium]